MKMKKGSNRFLINAIAILGLAALVMGGCWAKNISTPYYTQTTSYYCGAASAQMILNSEKLGIFVPSQATIYNYIHPRNQCNNWYSDPKGLCDALNNYAGSKAHFVVSALPNQDDAVKKLAYTIDKYGVPPASLIYGFMHWVVVRGVITSGQPTTASSYTIGGFFVNDPWYGSNSLGENKYIDIAHWKSDYFTSGAWCGAPGGNKYISVVDPEPVPRTVIKFSPVLPRRAQIISPAEAQGRATAAMQQFENQKEFQKQFAEAYAAMKSSQMGVPVLVSRSDKRADAYYIVPMQRGSLTAGALLIDAYSGQFLETSFVKQPVEYVSKLEISKAPALFKRNLPNLKVRPELMRELSVKPPQTTNLKPMQPMMAQQPALNLAAAKTFRQLNIKPEDVNITKMELVWEPSAESQNPYYPLWKASGSIKQGKEQVIGYMDAKGMVAPEITRKVDVKLQGGGR